MYGVLAAALAVMAGLCGYLAFRLHRGLRVFLPRLRYWMALLGVALLAALVMLGFMRSGLPSQDGVWYVLGAAGCVSMGVLLYLLLYTAVAELPLLAIRLLPLREERRRRCRGVTALVVLALTAATCIGGVVNAAQIRHVSYQVSMGNKADVSDLKLVLISDVYLGAVGSEEKLPRMVAEINTLEPDIVCIAGDFFDTDFGTIRNPEAAIRTLQGLRATHGVYASLGNHDGGGTFGQMEAFLQEAGIRLLKDEYVVIDDRLVLAGRLDRSPIGGYGGLKRSDLAAFLPEEAQNRPVVVMDHNPANIHGYDSRVDLILCGHTHQGQVFPGSLITDRMYAVDYGWYQETPDSPQVIVTSGVGTWGLPMRVGTGCEIVSIRMIPGE